MQPSIIDLLTDREFLFDLVTSGPFLIILVAIALMIYGIVGMWISGNAIHPADVLAYIDEWKGQEDLDNVARFAEDMAQMIAEGKTMEDAGEAGYIHFVEWVGER